MGKLVHEGDDVIFYGLDSGADVSASQIDYTLPESVGAIERVSVQFKVEHNEDEATFKIPHTLGQGVVYAALAAVAVGVSLGANLGEIANSLKDFKPLGGRMIFLRGIKETIIIDDSYNSSPLSADVALELLGKFTGGRKIAVLGDMRELGVNTESAHRELGRKAADSADIIFLIGEAVVFTREELTKAGFTPESNLFSFSSSEKAKLKVQEVLEPNDVVLVKGSKAVLMEKIIEEIRNIS